MSRIISNRSVQPPTFFSRVGRPSLAYICAVCVGSIVYHYAAAFLHFLNNSEGGWFEIFAGIWIFAILVGVLAGFVLALPTFFVVALVIWRGWARGWSDAIYGGVIATLGSFHNFSMLFETDGFQETLLLYGSVRFLPTLAGGVLAGLIYWLLVGMPSAKPRPVAGGETDL